MDFKQINISVRFLWMAILVVLISSCVRNKNFGNVESNPAMQKNSFVVKEVIQTDKYTYMRVEENLTEKWVAVNRQDANVGDVYFYEGVLQMNNFQSKALNRTFDEIFFLSKVSETPTGQSNGVGMPAHSGKYDIQENHSISMAKEKNEITIARLFGNREYYANKEVKIRGVAVKVNENVMDRNWVHIQDGTSFNSNFDLTVTTNDSITIGEEVTFKGKIILDKNFGSGYFYDIIMENAELVDPF